MYQQLLGEREFYRLLLRFDEDLAVAERALGCRRCGKVLHVGHYARKPRGAPPGLGEPYSKRFSFCCADRQCRKRRTPPSLRFLGRKVYLGAVVVLVSALGCGVTPTRQARLKEWVGVSRQTVLRWRQWWQEIFPRSLFWRTAQGALDAPVEIGALPLSLLEKFPGSARERLLELLRFLKPLTAGRWSAKAM
jgi:hypothetical protein